MHRLFLLLVCLSLFGCVTQKQPDYNHDLNWGSHLTSQEITQLKQLANNGDAAAAKRLDSYYGEYLGNTKEAAIWLRKAADYGDPEAQYNLGITIGAGSDSSKDQAEARKWIEKAALAGYKPAKEKLAKMKMGEGI